jgi:membrane associated rhomboid family serine protease
MRIKSVIIPIIALNFIMFLLQLFVSNFTSMFVLTADIWNRPYILVTSMFLHGDFNHIFWNMYGLMMFGPLLEQRIGWKRFLGLYLASGVFAALGHVLLSQVIYGNIPNALGASGAVMGMLGALIILMPDLRLLFMFFIPMSLRTAGIIWALMDLFGVFVPSGIGNIAHLIGMACGLLFGLLMNREKKKYYRVFREKGQLTIEDVDDYLNNGRI